MTKTVTDFLLLEGRQIFSSKAKRELLRGREERKEEFSYIVKDTCGGIESYIVAASEGDASQNGGYLDRMFPDFRELLRWEGGTFFQGLAKKVF